MVANAVEIALSRKRIPSGCGRRAGWSRPDNASRGNHPNVAFSELLDCCALR